jgi:hypothetical protein
VTVLCGHHWVYRGPRTASCQLCGEHWIAPPEGERAPYCEPYCGLFDQPSAADSEAEFCTDCGAAWTLRAVTEVEPDGTRRTSRGWVRL